MISNRVGDLFTSDAPVLGHGINCRGAMRAGIALQFSSRYPDMYEVYKEECKKDSIRPGKTWFWVPSEGPTIANIASQYRPGASARYDWAVSGIGEVVEYCKTMGYEKFAIPRIGAGIGGLDWEVMNNKLQRHFGHDKVVIEVWTL